MTAPKTKITAILISALFTANMVFAETADEPVSPDTENAVEITGESVDSEAQTIAENTDEPVQPEKEAAAGAVTESAESSIEAAEDAVESFAPSKTKVQNKIVDKPSGESAKPKAKTKKSSNESAASEKNVPVKEETRFKMSGILESGVDVITRVRTNRKDETEVRTVARGEIDISARPARGIRAEIGIEYDQRDTFITIDKFYGQYSIPDAGVLRAGIMKKAFGLEERAGLDERYFRRRSIINSGLEDDGFLDHDLTLQYRHNVGVNWRFIGGFSMSAALLSTNDELTDTMRYFQNYSAHYQTGNMDVIAAAVIQHFVPKEWYTTTFAASLSCKYAVKEWWISESELTFGTNTAAKIRQDEEQFIFGIRQQELFPINTGLKTLSRIIPVAEIALYWDDLENGYYETQIRGGLTFGLGNNNAFQFRNAFETRLRTQNGETSVRRYRYDSEIVVIF
ncbi:MAG: hypothetical protein LBI42_00900 [Chitinispirillales bacterium]|jgi:hypothetical protein|nr:hypothetical protein [Chitinispirillales bacterium]